MNYKKIYRKVFKNKQTYNLTHDECYIARKHTFDFVLNYLIKTKPQSLIDIGSGRGTLLYLIHQQFPHIKLCAVDIENNTQLIFNSNFIAADLSCKTDRQYLKDQSYDILTCIDVLEHLEKSLISYVLKTFSIVAPRSLFVVANHSSTHDEIQLHLIQENEIYWLKEIKKYYSIECVDSTSHQNLMLFQCISKTHKYSLN